ncbi:MAG: Smr/MutS family protein [Angelakisella sp.]
MIIINLEAGMPTVEGAMIQLRQSLLSAKARRVRVIKLIHGYGSTGKGGAIGAATRRELAKYRQSGAITDYIPGEEFSPFSPNARKALEVEPALRKDTDYTRSNQGITIVIV